MRFSSRYIQSSLIIALLLVSCVCYGAELGLSDNGRLSLTLTDGAAIYSFLAHFNTNLDALSPRGYIYSETGTPVISSTNKFGGGSIYCTYSSDTSAEYTFPSSIIGDAELSFWLYVGGVTTRGWTVRGGNFNLWRGSSTGDPRRITWSDGSIGDTQSGNIMSYLLPAAYTWYNVRLKKVSNTMYLYVDDVEISNEVISTNTAISSIKFGGQYFYTGYTNTDCWVDEPILVSGALADYPEIDSTIEQAPIILNGKLALAETDATAPPITDYIAWYDASDESTITDIAGAVQTWADKSSNGYDATIHTTAPTTASDTLNGLNVISFGADYMIMPNATIPAGAASYTMCSVFSQSVASLKSVFNMGAAGNSDMIGLFQNSGGTLRQFWYNNDLVNNGTYTSNIYSTITFDGTTRKTILNGVATSDTPTGKTTTPNSAYLGGGYYNFDGQYIAEFIIYHRGLSASEITQTETYLKTKWGL